MYYSKGVGKSFNKNSLTTEFQGFKKDKKKHKNETYNKKSKKILLKKRIYK